MLPASQYCVVIKGNQWFYHCCLFVETGTSNKSLQRRSLYNCLANECVNVFYYINSANRLCNTNFQPRLAGQCLFSPLDTEQRICPDPITSCIARSPIRQDADYTHDLLTMLSCRLAFNNLNGKIKYLTLTERSKVSG